MGSEGLKLAPKGYTQWEGRTEAAGVAERKQGRSGGLDANFGDLSKRRNRL